MLFPRHAPFPQLTAVLLVHALPGAFVLIVVDQVLQLSDQGTLFVFAGHGLQYEVLADLGEPFVQLPALAMELLTLRRNSCCRCGSVGRFMFSPPAWLLDSQPRSGKPRSKIGLQTCDGRKQTQCRNWNGIDPRTSRLSSATAEIRTGSPVSVLAHHGSFPHMPASKRFCAAAHLQRRVRERQRHRRRR